jgi:hypothetical protein
MASVYAGKNRNFAAGLQGRHAMGIDKQSELAANLQIGPTSLGMVRIYVEGEGVDLPLDFDPDEADEIAEELRAAAVAARAMGGGAGGGAGAKKKR